MKKIIGIWLLITFFTFFSQESAQSTDISKSIRDELIDITFDFVADEVTKKIKEIDLTALWKTFGLPRLQQLVVDDVMERNKNRYVTAVASEGVKLLKSGYSWEGDFLQQRLPIARKAYETLTKTSISRLDKVPKVACAFSGGGYRAMTVTAGCLKGLEDLGILDTVLYISTLSGSTWFLGPWTFMQNPFEKRVTVADYNDRLREAIGTNKLNLLSTANAATFNSKYAARDAIFPKIVFGQQLGPIDIYGMLLAHTFFNSFGDQEQRQQLSMQYHHIKQGNNPWPIYTAISMHKINEQYRYNWYEFNPEEVRNIALNLAIPAFAFGRRFDQGQSKKCTQVETDVKYCSPEQSFGFLMGIFGSAIWVNMKDVQRIYFSKKDQATLEGEKLVIALYDLAKQGKFTEIWNTVKDRTNLDKIRQALLAQLVNTVAQSDIGTKRIAPAQIYNPFKRFVPDHPWLNERELLTFIDAGIDYNIPLLPLFRPERGIDIIFIGDASDDLPGAQLMKALADVKRLYNISYTLDTKLSDNTLQVYRPDDAHKTAPILEYITFFEDKPLLQKSLKDPELKRLIESNKLMQFSAQGCLGKEKGNDFCTTFNFGYSLKEFNQLSGIVEFNVKAHKDLHLKLLQERLQEEEFGFGG
jgi:hypothetical protein